LQNSIVVKRKTMKTARGYCSVPWIALVWVGVLFPGTEIADSVRVPQTGQRLCSDKVDLEEAYGKVALYFIRNTGLLDERVKFYEKGRGHSTFFTEEGVYLELLTRQDPGQDAKPCEGCGEQPGKNREGESLQSLTRKEEPGTLTAERIKLIPVGANKDVEIKADGIEKGKVNYLVGSDPGKWQRNIPTYRAVIYKELYPGIDLKFYGNNRQLECDFMVAPGADPRKIRLAFEGEDGLEINGRGDLVLQKENGAIHMRKPFVYQEIDGLRKEVNGRYVFRPSASGTREGHYQIGFHVEAYDSTQSLVIDPILEYSTYLGGNYQDVGRDIFVTKRGFAYVTGLTASSPSFPKASMSFLPFQMEYGGGYYDAFVTRFTKDGSRHVYSTYLGGSGSDNGLGIAVDDNGYAYVTGYTESVDFPTKNALQPTHGGGTSDAFVTKLSWDGSDLIYSTYLGGNDKENPPSNLSHGDIAIDADGYAYVTGATLSSNFPTTKNAFQKTMGGSSMAAFVVKVKPDGSELVYATFLGSAYGHDVAVDPNGAAFVTGQALSEDYPTTENPLQKRYGGRGDAFVTKLKADGSDLIYSTFLGGSDYDYGSGIALDENGCAYVVGTTGSKDFPTGSKDFPDRDVIQPDFAGTLPGDTDGFVAKVSESGADLVYSTYLGGSRFDNSVSRGGAIAVSPLGFAYVTGSTSSLDDFPIKDAIPKGRGDRTNAFVTMIDPDGLKTIYSTFLGGLDGAAGYGIALEAQGTVYVTGVASGGFPTENPEQPLVMGLGDAFVAKIKDDKIEVMLSAGPRNPVNKSMGLLTPDLVNHIKLTASDGDISLKALTYDFVGDDPSVVSAVSLERDNDCDGYSESKIDEAPILENMMWFPDLDETIPANDEVCYGLYFTIPAIPDLDRCKPVGASIAAPQVEADRDGETAEMYRRSTVKGTILKGECRTLVLYIHPQGSGTITSVEKITGDSIICPDDRTRVYRKRAELNLTAKAHGSYQFDHWFGDMYGNKNRIGITMDSDKTVRAYFKDQSPSDGKNHGKLKDPVNTATGEFYFDIPLLDLGGPLPLAFGLYYGSAVAAKQDVATAFGDELGLNWLHNFQKFRLYKDDTKTRILYDRGKILPFELKGTEWELASTEDVPYVLKADAAGYYYLWDPHKELVYLFDTDRRLARIEDRNGNNHTLTYDASGHLVTVSDGLGRTLNFTYATDRLTRVGDGHGRTFTFGYTGGLLTSVTDPMDHVSTFEYDATYPYPLITKVIYPEGNSHYTQTYDENGRVITQTDAYGNATNIAFDEQGQSVITYTDGTQVGHAHMNEEFLTDYTDQSGNSAVVDYDESNRRSQIVDRMGGSMALTYHAETGRLSSITNTEGDILAYSHTVQSQQFTNPDNSGHVTFMPYGLSGVDYPDGAGWGFTYDARGNPITWVGQDGQTWSYTYNSRGQILTAANPAGGVITYTYNADGTLATRTDSDTGTTTYSYDAYKRVNRITHPDGATFQIARNLNGQITSVINENGSTQTFTYDANGNLVKVTDPAGKETMYAYDLLGRVNQFTDRLGRSSTLTYNNMRRLALVIDPNGFQTATGYNARGWLDQVTLGGQNWETGYDDEGVVASRTTPLGQTTHFETNKLGFSTGVTNPLGQTTTITLDAMSRVTRITDPLSRTTEYGYDSRGFLSGVTLPALGTAHYTYNDLGLLSKITDLNGNDWTFGYSGMGRLHSSTDPLGNTWQYAYNTRGRLSQITYPGDAILTLTYDSAGNITRKLYSDGTDLQFTYDDLDRLITANVLSLTMDAEGRVTATDNSGTVFGTAYDHGGRIVTLTYNNDAFQVTYTYSATTGLLSTVTDNLTGMQIDFTYDDDLHLTGIIRSNRVHATFTYDNAGRLTGIQEGKIIDIQYTLDAAGHVTQANMTAPLDPAALLTTRTDTFTYDKVYRVNSAGYGYDDRGRLTASPAGKLTWDGTSRLTGIDDATLTYNGLDDLVTRTEGGTSIHYYYNYAIDHTPIVAEKNESTDQFLRYYVWTPGGSLLYMIDAAEGNKVYFYHFDRIGSTLALTDPTGTVTDSYAYTPYGELLQHSGSNEQPFTYAGRRGVRKEGTVYQMRARYYDPVTARFFSREPVWPDISDAGQLNPHQYALLNPVSNVDFTGLKVLKEWSPLGEAVAEGIAQDPTWWLKHANIQPRLKDVISKYMSSSKACREKDRVLAIYRGISILRKKKTYLEAGWKLGLGTLWPSKLAKKMSAKELGRAVRYAKVGTKFAKALGPVGVGIEGLSSSVTVGGWGEVLVLEGSAAAARETQKDSYTAYVVAEADKIPYVRAPIRWTGSVVSWLAGD